MLRFIETVGPGGAVALILGFLATLLAFRLYFQFAARHAATERPASESALVKKRPGVDIARFRSMFFAIALTFTFLFVGFVFEYPTYKETELLDLGTVDPTADQEVIDIPPTQQKPPPPPKIVQPKIVEVADVKEVEEEIEILLDTEFDEDDVVEVQETVEEFAVEEPEEEVVVDEIFEIVENPAEPVGGFKAFYAYVGETLEYPKSAARLNISGRVYLQFVVEKDGTLTDIVVARGIGGGCDEEAVRVLSEAPAWNPGKQRGKPVRQRMVIPVRFVLKQRGAM